MATKGKPKGKPKGKAKASKAKAPKLKGTKAIDFDAFVSEARAALQAKLDRGKEHFGLGSYESFDVDQRRAQMQFSSDGAVRLVARMQIVGSIGSGTGTWMWSWANESIVRAARKELDVVRGWGENHGVAPLSTPVFEADEGDAWSLTAVVASLLESECAYRIPTANGAVFVVLDQLKMQA